MPEQQGKRKGRTPIRAVRCEDDLWLPALAKAARRDESLSQVIRRGLRAYLAEEEE